MEFKDDVEFTEQAESDKLYMAILTNNAAEIERLREDGTVLSDHMKGMLITGGGNLVKGNGYGADWYDYTMCLSMMPPDEAVSVIRNFRREVGEPLYYSDSTISIQRYYRPDVFKCILECFDNKRMRKMRDLKKIVDLNRPQMLETAAEHGWLALTRQRDTLIEYSRAQNRVECTAWLLDFQNRTVDAASERARAEKRQNAELNASPDSVIMLKKLWLYDKREDGTIRIKKYKGDRTEITVPQKIGKNIVTAIEVDTYDWGSPKRCFVSPNIQKTITKIILPKGIVSIGSGIFYQFTGLREINFPDGVSSIGMRTFYGCESLRRLTLPNSVKEIGSNAFSCCKQLEEINIPQGVTEICGEVFAVCEKLKAVEIPDSVKSIGYRAFYSCRSLEEVLIPNGVTEISEGAFSGCEKLTRVELPDTIVKIGKYAFNGCAALKELVIPEGVREIRDVAFADCAALERIVLPASLEKAKNYTQKGIEPRTIFYNSPNVTAVVTPKSYAEKYCKRNGIPFVYKEN